MKIAVLMGGPSSEREISLKTGHAVAQALQKKGYDVVTLDLTPQTPAQLLQICPDMVYIALHGRPGEDGTVQGMLEILGLPYVGSGVLASAVGMDKLMAKRMFAAAGIPTPKDIQIKQQDWQNNSDEVLALIKRNFELPIVIKANAQGSALGVHIIHNQKEVANALTQVFQLDNQALVEEYIPGTEITVALLGNPPQALPVIEIVPKTGFYDFTAKYAPGMSEHLIPARLPDSVCRRAQDFAVCAFETLGCLDYARVDFRVTPAGDPYILEVNTLPGMTATSLVPDAARAAGIDFPDLCEYLIKSAMQRR